MASSSTNNIMNLLLCGCCKSRSSNTEILLEESGYQDMQRKQYTVIFSQCPKGIGITVKSSIKGPTVSKVTKRNWNQLEEGDKLLSINNENCVDSSPEVVQFLMMNLYEKNEAVFQIERGGKYFNAAC